MGDLAEGQGSDLSRLGVRGVRGMPRGTWRRDRGQSGERGPTNFERVTAGTWHIVACDQLCTFCSTSEDDGAAKCWGGGGDHGSVNSPKYEGMKNLPIALNVSTTRTMFLHIISKNLRHIIHLRQDIDNLTDRLAGPGRSACPLRASVCSYPCETASPRHRPSTSLRGGPACQPTRSTRALLDRNIPTPSAACGTTHKRHPAHCPTLCATRHPASPLPHRPEQGRATAGADGRLPAPRSRA